MLKNKKQSKNVGHFAYRIVTEQPRAAPGSAVSQDLHRTTTEPCREMSDWSQVLQDDSEREAFFSLLDQYFARDTAPVLTASTPHTTSISTSRPAYVPPAPAPAVRTLPEPVPTQSFSSRFQDNTAFKNSLAGAALKNTSVTSAALRNAGMSAGAANAASKFGSQHSEVLAPHLANAAQQGWNNRSGAASTIGITAKAPGPAPKGPHRPAGLSSSKSIAGGFSTESGGAVSSFGCLAEVMVGC